LSSKADLIDIERIGSTFKGHRFPREINSHAIWLYHRFTLSFREVEELLAERGITVSYEATDGVHKWLWTVGEPKSKRSHRRVGVSERVLQVLSSLKQSREGSSGLLFPGESGGFIDPDYFDEFIFKPVKKAAGLSEFRFHDLRHFFASMLIAVWYKNSAEPLSLSLQQLAIPALDSRSTIFYPAFHCKFCHLEPSCLSCYVPGTFS
jgi:integrase